MRAPGIAAIAVLVPLAAIVAAVSASQSAGRGNRWALYEHEMQDPVDDPHDAWEKTEFAFGRLRFRSLFRGRGYARWGIDLNKSDRQFLVGLRRLTRVHARSVEQILDIGHDEMFHWPFMFAVSVGDWTISGDQAARLRAYFDRGGFLLVDDFHNEREWALFMAGMDRVYPGVRASDIEDDDPIFHTVYDLTERFQVPGLNVVHGPGYERGGVEPHWRAIRDANGRIVVAICHNMDLGDAWEWADLPEYPEKYASMAYRLGVNYVVYAMTH